MNYTILLVDDVSVNRLIMEKLLNKHNENYHFIHADNGDEALKALELNMVDLMILDLMMPEKDGFYVLTQMRKAKHHEDIPVIVYTALNDMESISKTLQLGALDFFLKPLTQDQMEVVIPLKVKNALMHHTQRNQLKTLNQQMSKDIELAMVLQASLIRLKDDFSPWKIETRYLASSGVSGDVFDFVNTEHGLWLIIADVVGHGVAAAMMSAMVKVMFRYGIRNDQTPANLLHEMNQFFCNLFESDNSINFSAFVAFMSEDQVTFSNGGHPYSMLIHHNIAENRWEINELEMYGFTLGLFSEATFQEDRIVMGEGDYLICYTDGLYDSLGGPHDLMIALDELLNLKAIPVPMLIDQLIQWFRLDEVEKYDDDVAIFWIGRNGEKQ